MNITAHTAGSIKIAEITSDEVILHNAQDALDILGNTYYQGFDKVILHQKNITPTFFDLKTKIAGDILQKFSNYKMSLAIVGDFSSYTSRSLQDFIFESNKGKQVAFVSSVVEALAILG